MSQTFQIPPFTLYGLVGCPHCGQAEQYLRVRGIPVNLVVANEDPVADAGIKAVLQDENAQYPVLVNRISRGIVKGFDEGKYRELSELFFAMSGAGTPNVFGGGFEPVPQTANAAEVAGPAVGAN